MPRTASRAKKNSVTVDLTDVESRGRLTEGDHLLEVDEMTVEDGQEHKYLKWKFKASEDDPDAGGVVYLNTSTAPQSLWALRALLESLGVEIPDGPLEIDGDDMVGAQMMATISMEEYDGKPQPRIADHWLAEEETPAPAPAATPARAARGAAKAAAAAPAKAAATAKAAPAKARGNGKAAATKAAAAEASQEDLTQSEVNEMSQDELEDVIKEFDLSVNLGDFKTLRKMRAAVIDAAEEAKVLTA